MYKIDKSTEKEKIINAIYNDRPLIREFVMAPYTKEEVKVPARVGNVICKYLEEKLSQMIIKKKAKSTAENTSGTQGVPKGSANIIKPNKLKQKALEKKEKELLQKEQTETEKNETPAEQKPKKTPLEEKLEEYEKIDVSVLEFKERY